MIPHVHLLGNGRGATIITSDFSASGFPPDSATVFMASDTSLKSISVLNTGSGNTNVAIAIGGGISNVEVESVFVESSGTAQFIYAIACYDSNTSATIKNTVAKTYNGTTVSATLVNTTGASTEVDDSDFFAFGPALAKPISNSQLGTSILFRNSYAHGAGGTNSYGLQNRAGAISRIYDSIFEASGGESAIGIDNRNADSIIYVYNSTMASTSPTQYAHGLRNVSQAVSEINNCVIKAHGGIGAYAINNQNPDSVVRSWNSRASASGASSISIGINNADSGRIAFLNGATSGDTYCCRQNGGSTFNIISTRLGNAANGNPNCVACTRSSTFLANGCP
jgi:hypothetical protein